MESIEPSGVDNGKGIAAVVLAVVGIIAVAVWELSYLLTMPFEVRLAAILAAFVCIIVSAVISSRLKKRKSCSPKYLKICDTLSIVLLVIVVITFVLRFVLHSA